MNGIQAMVRQMEARPTPPTDLHAHIITLSENMSQRQIAHKVGVSRTTVCNVLRAAKEKQS